MASNGGRDATPSWWLNLKNHPEAWIQIKKEKTKVAGRMASPEEKLRLWPMLTKMYPGYAKYQTKTKRVIPVVVLEPR